MCLQGGQPFPIESPKQGDGEGFLLTSARAQGQALHHGPSHQILTSPSPKLRVSHTDGEPESCFQTTDNNSPSKTA